MASKGTRGEVEQVAKDALQLAATRSTAVNAAAVPAEKASARANRRALARQVVRDVVNANTTTETPKVPWSSLRVLMTDDQDNDPSRTAYARIPDTKEVILGKVGAETTVPAGGACYVPLEAGDTCIIVVKGVTYAIAKDGAGVYSMVANGSTVDDMGDNNVVGKVYQVASGAASGTEFIWGSTTVNDPGSNATGDPYVCPLLR